MRRILFVFCCSLIALVCKAQSSVDFTASTASGEVFYFHIIDAVNRNVEVTQPNRSSYVYKFLGKDVTLPSTVTNSNTGITYTVTQIGEYGLESAEMASLTLPVTIKKLGDWSFMRTKLGSLHLPEGLETISRGAFFISNGLKTLKIPSTVRNFGEACFCQMFDLERMDGLKELHLQTIVGQFFFCNYNLKMELDFLQDVKVIQPMAFDQTPITSVTLPASVEQIGFNAFNCDNLTKVIIHATIPPTLTQDNTFGTNTSQKIYVPVDASAAYKNAAYWKNIKDRMLEQLTIGVTGYTSYYLENENFEVPAGCTAYIITGITPSGNPATPDQAQVTAFTAGKIIPKQTGFILQGTPSSTIEYYAAVTGTEESVAGNLLIGTATEQEFNASGYKYYIFSNNGDEGLGFYKQGTRNGASIKLAAHRAGLRLPEAIAPAKGFTIDFESARKESETTGIRTVKPTTPAKEDVVYDLQGRRVTNPGRGIYIVNGKKIIK